MDTLPPEMPQPSPTDAAPPPKRYGAKLFALKVLGFSSIVLASWWATDRSMLAWVNWQEDVAQHLADAGVHPDRGLPALNALGDADALHSVVVGCDLRGAPCRQLVGRLLDFREARRPDLRLVVLQRPERDDLAGEDFAVALQAAARQNVFWPLLRRLAEEPGLMDVSGLKRHLGDVHGFALRLQRDIDDEDVRLRAGLDRIMAEALEIPLDCSVLVAGQPLAEGACASAQTLEEGVGRSLDLQDKRLAAHHGVQAAMWQELLANRPSMARRRFVAWIVHGQRLHALAHGGPKHGHSSPP